VNELSLVGELINCIFGRFVKSGSNPADFFQLVKKKMNWNKSIWAQ